MIFQGLSKAPRACMVSQQQHLKKYHTHFITPHDDNSVSLRCLEVGLHVFLVTIQSKMSLIGAIPFCRLQFEVFSCSHVSLTAHSLPQTATIICLKNFFSLRIDIGAVSLNPLRNGSLRSLVH